MVRIAADVRNFENNIQKADRDLSLFGEKIGGLTALSNQAALAITGIGAGLLGLTGIFVRAASEAQDVQARLRSALESSAQASEQNVKALLEQAKAMEAVSRFSDEAIASSQGFLLATGRSVEEVQRLTPRLVDLAALFKIDLAEAASIFNLAIQGNTRGLRRFGINLKDVGDEIRSVDDLLRILGQKGLGAAQRDLNTFSGALANLKNQLNNVQESLGTPFLAPLTRLINLMSAGAVAIKAFGDRFPFVAGVIGTFVGVMGTLLVGVGLLRLALTKVVPLFLTFGTSMAAVGTTSAAAAAKIALTARAVQALGIAIKATIIGAVISLVLQAIADFDSLGETFHRVFSFMIAVVREFGQALVDIHLGTLSLDFKRIEDGVKRLRNALDTANQESKDVVRGMKLAREAADAAGAGMDDAEVSARKLAEAFAKTSAEAELLSAKTQVLANDQARLALSQQGLSVADVTAIEERRLDAIRDATEKEVQLKIDAKRVEITNLRKTLDEESTAVRKARGELSKLEVQLSQSRVELVKKTAEEVVRREFELSKQRLQIEAETISSRADLQRKELDAVREVGEARTRLEQELSQQRLDLFRVEEETRVSMLKRVVDAELSLGSKIIKAREDILNIQFRRETALLRSRTIERAQLVREGALLEADAERQNAEERQELARENVKRQIDIESERVDLLKRQRTIEIALAKSAFDSKVVLIRAEIAVRRAAVDADQEIQVEAIKSRVLLLRSETEEKIKLLELELQAKVDELKAELRAEEAAGRLSTTEREQRERAITLTVAAAANRRNALIQSFVIANQSAFDQINIINKRADSQRTALDSQLNAQLLGAQAEFQDRFRQIQEAGLQDSIDSRRRLADLEIDLLNSINDERERLRQQGETEGEIARLLGPSTALLTTVQKLQQRAGQQAERELSVLEQVYKTFADRVKKDLQDVLDLITKIGNPQQLFDFLSRLGPAVAEIGVQTGGGQVTRTITNNFNFSGVNVNLTADEALILDRVIRRMTGPAGGRVMDEVLRKQPGPR